MSQSLRIALISEHASPLAISGGVDVGGQNVYVAQVARCLAQKGHQVDILTRRDSADVPTVVHLRPGIRVVHIDAGPAQFVPKEALLPYMEAFCQGCENLVRNGVGYDIAHANFFMSGMAAQRLQKTLGVPYVITFHALGMVRLQHQGTQDHFPPERIEIERELMHEADAVIAECPQDEADFTHLYGAQPYRVRLVPCGFDASEFGPMNRQRARAELGLAPHEFVILQLGRLVPRKGIDNVIASLKDLPSHVPARLLVVGGDGPEPDEERTPEFKRLKEVAREAGVEDRIQFVGHRQRADLRRYYAAANVFVTTPWYEPFGITPLEAMACGTPVVASAVGGLQYSVTDGVTGYLVPPRDPAALARCLAHLQANPRLASAMGRAGMRRVRSLFTWERVSDLLEEVYMDVLKQNQLTELARRIDRSERPTLVDFAVVN
ncbi:MAG: glycosyltransferase family 4 protein [Acidobacteriota bacterium]